MKAWIVYYSYDYEGGYVVGIFTNEKKAQKCFEKIQYVKGDNQYIDKIDINKEIDLEI